MLTTACYASGCHLTNFSLGNTTHAILDISLCIYTRPFSEKVLSKKEADLLPSFPI